MVRVVVLSISKIRPREVSVTWMLAGLVGTKLSWGSRRAFPVAERAKVWSRDTLGSMVSDLLARRVAERIDAALVHAERLRGAVPLLARGLRERGATRVVLFGSLASGAPPHEGTDIDLCVEGLSQAEIERAALDLAEHVAAVDLVRWETASPELRAVVAQYGIAIGDE